MHYRSRFPTCQSPPNPTQSCCKIGEAILFHSLLLAGYVLLAAVVVHLFVVIVEEPSLRRQFGESYETYLRTVPRWLPHRARVQGKQNI